MLSLSPDDLLVFGLAQDPSEDWLRDQEEVEGHFEEDNFSAAALDRQERERTLECAWEERRKDPRFIRAVDQLTQRHGDNCDVYFLELEAKEEFAERFDPNQEPTGEPRVLHVDGATFDLHAFATTDGDEDRLRRLALLDRILEVDGHLREAQANRELLNLEIAWIVKRTGIRYAPKVDDSVLPPEDVAWIWIEELNLIRDTQGADLLEWRAVGERSQGHHGEADRLLTLEQRKRWMVGERLQSLDSKRERLFRIVPPAAAYAKHHQRTRSHGRTPKSRAVRTPGSRRGAPSSTGPPGSDEPPGEPERASRPGLLGETHSSTSQQALRHRGRPSRPELPVAR